MPKEGRAGGEASAPADSFSCSPPPAAHLQIWLLFLCSAGASSGAGGVGCWWGQGAWSLPHGCGAGTTGHLEGAGPRIAWSSEPLPDPACISPEQNVPVKPLGAGDPLHPSSSTVQPWILQDQGSQQMILATGDEGSRHKVLDARSGLQPRGVPRGLNLYSRQSDIRWVS